MRYPKENNAEEVLRIYENDFDKGKFIESKHEEEVVVAEDTGPQYMDRVQ